ncbi:MAG: TRAP transporter small permease [Rhodobiaceae bacterium]|nr:TRAP transporter small permease [Rhodobiaceae bacterium]
MAAMRQLRRALDAFYFGCGVLAALCLIAILVIIVLQMVARWTGFVIPGATSYAGYAMATASFLAFAHALNRGSHIRVSILLNSVSPTIRWFLEIWCFGIATALAWYLARYVTKAVYWSWKLKDVSQGQDATPLWIPQLSMSVGAIILAVALTDNLINVLLTRKSRITSDVVSQSHGE